MTKQELMQARWLESEIRMHRSRLAELQSNGKGRTVSDSVRGSSITVPFQLKTRVISGISCSHRSRAAQKEIVERHALIAEAERDCERAKLTIEQYIRTIPDSLIRQAMTWYFVEGLTWNQTAKRIGGGNTGEGLRKAVERFFKTSG